MSFPTLSPDWHDCFSETLSLKQTKFLSAECGTTAFNCLSTWHNLYCKQCYLFMKFIESEF